MRWLIVVPFTEMGYYKLATFLRQHACRALLPIPRAICAENYEILNYVPESYLRVWRPILDLVHDGEIVADCYLEIKDIEKSIDVAIRVASLVIKARVYGKVDVAEWLSTLPKKLEPKITNWSGLLVVDRFVDYILLTELNIPVDRLLAVDIFAPTPLDLLTLIAGNAIEWRCSLLDIINWAVKYIGEIVVHSRDLTEAYTKLTRNPEYRELVRNCAPSEYALYW